MPLGKMGCAMAEYVYINAYPYELLSLLLETKPRSHASCKGLSTGQLFGFSEESYMSILKTALRLLILMSAPKTFASVNTMDRRAIFMMDMGVYIRGV